jgi:hypothetical protein
MQCCWFCLHSFICSPYCLVLDMRTLMFLVFPKLVALTSKAPFENRCTSHHYICEYHVLHPRNWLPSRNQHLGTSKVIQTSSLGEVTVLERGTHFSLHVVPLGCYQYWIDIVFYWYHSDIYDVDFTFFYTNRVSLIFEDILFSIPFIYIYIYIYIMQEPSYLGNIFLVSTRFRMVLT